MITELSGAMGLAASDPLFWLPLVMAALTLLALLGVLLLDGIVLGAGLLMPWIAKDERVRIIRSLKPIQAADQLWLALLIASSMAAFPYAWSAMADGLYLPLLLIVLGAIARTVVIRHSVIIGNELMVWFYAATAAMGAVGFGLLLADYVTGQRFYMATLAFVALIVVSMVAVFVLLASTWVMGWAHGALQWRCASLAAFSARWTAAGMVGLSFMLALANPAIFYRWTHGDNLELALLWWVLMLAGFVWLDRLVRLRATAKLAEPSSMLPLGLSWLLVGLMLAGLVYSIFPFLILDEMTLWDAAAPLAPLQIVGVASMLTTLVVLVIQGWNYRGLFNPRPDLPVV